jgi:hypothetical protein
MLGTLKVNRKVKPVLTAFVSLWILLTVLIISLSIVVSLILGALVLIIYIPFILFDILLEKLFNKG